MDALIAYIRTTICDPDNATPGLAGQMLNAYSGLPGSGQYYIGGDGWFPESTLQGTVYRFIQQYVQEHTHDYLVLQEQRYPQDPDNRRSDIIVVDTVNDGRRLGIELKADFNLSSAQEDMTKLLTLWAEDIVSWGLVIFACRQGDNARWIQDLQRDAPSDLRAAAVAQRP